MRGQLTNLAEALHSAIEKISEQSNGVLSLNPNYYDQKSRAMQEIVKNAALEHKKALERRVYIERNKERAEELAKEKERLDLKRRSEARRADIAAEQKRLVEESKKREEARAQREAETVKRASAIERMKELKTVMGSHSTVFDDLNVEEFSQMDAQEIVKKQVEFLDKEQQIQEQKLKSVARKQDHLERAKRQEEIPLYVAKYKERKEEDLVAWQHLQEKKDADARAKHENDVQTKNRLLTVMGHLVRHKERTVSTRRAEFDASESEFLAHVLRVRDERIAEERLERERMEQERIAAEERARREEAEREEREEQRRIQEEAERQQQEHERQQREQEISQLRELEDKKRLREKEMMSRQQSQSAEPRGWRDREQERYGGGGSGGSGQWRTNEPPSQQPPRRMYSREDGSDAHRDGRRDDGPPPSRGSGSMFGGGGGSGTSWRDRHPQSDGGQGLGGRQGYSDQGGARRVEPRGFGGDRGPRNDRYGEPGGNFNRDGPRGVFDGDRGASGASGAQWRTAAPPRQQVRSEEAPKEREQPPQPPQPTVDDDGFTAVRGRR